MEESSLQMEEFRYQSYQPFISIVLDNEDFEWIEKELSNQSKKGHFEINSQYIAVLLRIADYLDIDEQRAPLYLYKYLQPKEFGH